MQAPTAPPAEHSPDTLRPLRHLASTAVLGLVTVAVGTPMMIASSFGGLSALLVALGLLTVLSVALAVAIDRATGPVDPDSAGSVLRGVTVGLVGTGTAALVGVAVVQADLRAELVDPLLVAAATLPFPVVAGLQWPGAVRRGTALLVALSVAGVLAARYPGAAREWQDERVLNEVGTLARPWVTEVDGFRGRSPQHTGTELISTPYLPADGGEQAEFRLFRDAPTAVPGDPCTAATAPGITTGEQVVSCSQVAPDRWSFTTEYSQVLLGRAEDAWVGVTAGPDTPTAVLDAALDGARSMTGDEYDQWLDEVLPGTPPSGTY